MKKIFASFFFVLVTFPISSFACGGGGDCGGMELPPPPVPVPGPVDNLLGVLSDHAGLTAGLALAALIAALLSRGRRLPETQSGEPSFASGTL